VTLTPGTAGTLGGIAVGALGVAALVVLVVRGRFTPRRAAAWAIVVGYLTLLWIYALSPAPPVAAILCRDPNLTSLPNLFGIDPGPRGLIADPSFQELVLNTALFLPFGALIAVNFPRGVASVAAIGLGVSVAGELTQLTGSWGLYPCAYRQFSLEDILLNTAGATMGALVVWIARKRPWGPAYIDPESGRAGTRGRRILAIGLDLIVVLVGAVATVVFFRLVLTTGLNRPFELANGGGDALLGVGVAVALEAIVLMITGMTVGEQMVDLRRRGRSER
jgi:hypothetical protein